MTPVVQWMGGWASSLQCWEPQLREAFPAWEHRFIDTHRCVSKTPVEAGLTGLPEGHVVAAWSMGSLLAHQWMAMGIWPTETPLLSLCPIFRFAGPEGIAEPILIRMKTKLESKRETVLRDFWNRLPEPGTSLPLWEKAWLTGSAGYSNTELLQGLDFLQNVSVDPETLSPVPRNWELLAGTADPLAKPGRWKNRLPKNAALRLFPGGHLPFQSCPGLIADALNRLCPAHVH